MLKDLLSLIPLLPTLLMEQFLVLVLLVRTLLPNYNGADSFTFKVNDGTVDSATATVSITVNAVNDVPVANAQSKTTK